MKKVQTSEKILEAAMNLFSQKGYNTVSTKEIAKEAGVSEMTVFRHFESKRNLFEQAFDKYVFFPKVKSLFEHELEGDLQKDLTKICCVHQETLMKNKKIILMELKDQERTAELNSPLFKFPNQLKKMLISYFANMKKKGKVTGEPEILAMNFLAANVGFFMTFCVTDQLTQGMDKEHCIAEYINIFTKGVTS